MRSGRTEEAMEYLLDGAHRAVRRGATHEAEFRLLSALEQFTGEKLTEAVLILTRLIQEQERWQDSLACLERDPAAWSSTAGHVYRQTAHIGMNQLLPSELEETIAFMRQVILARPADMRAALAAVELASLIQTQSHDDALLPILLELVRAAEELEWPGDEATTVLLTKLKLLFNLGMTISERASALQQVQDLATRTNASQTPSRRSISLMSGIGILAGTLGKFEQSIAQIEAAKKLAQRLDNASHLAAAHANLALRHSWLGNYQKQREHAAYIAESSQPVRASTYSTIIATYEYALASIVLGDHPAARRAIDQQRLRIPPTATIALQQTWMMHQADLRQLLREDDAALQLSRHAFDLGSGKVLAWRTSAGAASRAALRLLKQGSEGEAQVARELMASLYVRRERMELSEETELLAAYLIACEDPERRREVMNELRMALESMPAPAALRLSALGTPPPPELLMIDD